MGKKKLVLYFARSSILKFTCRKNAGIFFM